MLTRLMTSAIALSLAAVGGVPGNAQPVSSAPPAPVLAQSRPNVLLWLMDDVGFAQVSSFGGLVQTPNIDRVAARGLRYSNYHTAAICSASRAALLTGRNPHSVHMGGHAGSLRLLPGYDAKVPADAGTIAANMQAAGYVTFALGKWDHLPSQELSPAGPFVRWPTEQGFDKFYGFLGAMTDNWNPVLLSDKTPLVRPDTPDYHLSADLADKAIAMINSRSVRATPAPFMMYFATGAAHSPHHAPREWIDRYRGKFDMGWDKARELILQRQIKDGLVPASARLGPRPEGMPAWDSLTADQKRLYARQMEVFAAALSHADEQFGRVLDALQQSGELDNTIVAITSDNGASAEGAFHGDYNEYLFVNGHQPQPAENMPYLDKWGGPDTSPHYSFGWAVAGNTPFRYYKQTTYEGGTRVPLVISWPKGIAARGETRRQFVSVDDVAPTIMELAGVPLAPTINNVQQRPMEGVSFRQSLGDANASDQKQAQYFEMYGNKALWSKGWTIVTNHRSKTWNMDTSSPITEPWELYDLTKDIAQTTNLASRYPARVAEMAQLFDEQARRYNVYPIGDIGQSRADVTKLGQELFARRGGKWVFPTAVASIQGISGGVAPPIQLLPFHMTATVNLATGQETGPIFALGGHLGGMGLYLNRGVPTFIFREFSGKATTVSASKSLHAGRNRLEFSFMRRPAAPLSPQDVQITIKDDNETLMSTTAKLAMPYLFNVSETFDLANDYGSSLTTDYPAGLPFPGSITDMVFDFNQH